MCDEAWEGVQVHNGQINKCDVICECSQGLNMKFQLLVDLTLTASGFVENTKGVSRKKMTNRSPTFSDLCDEM